MTGRPANVPEDLPLARGHLLLVGTGSFSVTLLPTWALLLRRWYGTTVRACLTWSATRLVAPDALAAATRSPVAGPGFGTGAGTVEHQELALWADLVVVAPATAAFVGKCAHGISDSLALSVVTSTTAPVVIAPAFAEAASGKPSVRRNVALLAEDGYTVVGPRDGTSVHTDQVGPGAMADLGAILRAARDLL
ncbi:flavoprotein [Actinokineospora diospyrosa]|uniref:Flavoprotein n=1 Tax=Actinokineospora diospyrosa TaxID=103728 RepID=A0ABT1I9X8_9PSEU|nr:flavoprotein [Actinokineospora diospyrosa]MCP2269392.1 Flavoprotein [Actinokineospora diospyrosa]